MVQQGLAYGQIALQSNAQACGVLGRVQQLPVQVVLHVVRELDAGVILALGTGDALHVLDTAEGLTRPEMQLSQAHDKPHA